MPEEFDFSELRNYLQGQMDMGDSEIFLDEPWTLNAKKPRPNVARTVETPQAIAARTLAQAPSPAPVFERPQNPESAPAPLPTMAMPSARPVARKAAAAFESAESLDAFYAAIAAEPVYATLPSLYRYEGPMSPRVLLLFDFPIQGVAPGAFFQSPVGEMLVRLFASLNIPAESIGVSFFYKGGVPRNLPALLETSLRKMLSKELSFIAPSVMVSFGEPLFHRLFGKGQNFNDLAGTDLEFSGVKACALVDAVAMSQDKQLKWVTWKVHIPKSSYFKA